MMPALFLFASSSPSAQEIAPLRIAVDATQAMQKIYHVRETIPVRPGPVTLVYPKWIPGYHGPVGPIEAVVSFHVSAGGNGLEWRRDLVDMYAVHVTVPAGATNLDVTYDIVGAPSHNGQTEPVSTPEMALLEYSNFVMYLQGQTAEATTVDASLTLPAGWTFGTALPVRSHVGPSVAFAPASLYTLVDSPVIAGAHERAFPLSAGQELDVAADGDAALALTPKFITGMKHLVAEGPALYGGKHFRDYHFLLTLSDAIGFEGIEHHESSDDRAPEKYAADDEQYRFAADLLPHEYSHSWNGKYRRPADLTVADYQQPELTDLLWVYEGLNQYNGEKLATRARLIDFKDRLDDLALTAAGMDVESGRDWRPIRDTADGAPFLYESPRQYYNLRRSAGDFYSEGNLIWLEADVTIRRLTGDAKSLDDFCKLWGDGSDQTAVPKVRPYTESDVYAILNQVVPYDWAGFFKARIASIEPRAPLGGVTGGGYKLVYSNVESDYQKAANENAKVVDARFSLGLTISTDGDSNGRILDVLTQGAGYRAGLAPDMRIIAVDGRKWSGDALNDALRSHKGGSTPLEMIVTSDDFYKVVKIDASAGERYPHLVRDAGPDELAKIYAPKTFVADPER
ncbi:MAG: M61 family metallopeptidase [Candidatus Eremiobacteraeota bacterium]|nr:M61 family metallopeptidase [Candidatus Eremiobacteraeota bacterium]